VRSRIRPHINFRQRSRGRSAILKPPQQREGKAAGAAPMMIEEITGLALLPHDALRRYSRA
jgi:hypothetical protein